MSSYAGYLLETFLTLALVCGVAFGVLYGARRLGLGRPSGPITLVGQLPLDGRRAIYLVRVAKQIFVVGAADGGFTKLGEIDAADLAEGGVAAHGSRAASLFGELLARGHAKSRPVPGGPDEP